jgi:hypothetical protein
MEVSHSHLGHIAFSLGYACLVYGEDHFDVVLLFLNSVHQQ